MATVEPRPTEAAPEVDERWLAVHVFYAGNARPLLTDCVKPLFERLTAEGMICGYFFLHYWLEGPHIRVRFKPTEGNRDAVVAAAEEAIQGFLQHRPSLHEVKSDVYVGLYNTLFELEFDAVGRAEYLDDGRMRLRKNNSMSWEQYRPEYDKYGGPEGVELAERHFAQSSDLVLGALVELNVHLRTVQLGLSVQLMMVTAAAFLDRDDQLEEFFAGYRDFWHDSLRATGPVPVRNVDDGHEATDNSLVQRFRVIRSAVRSGQGDRLPGALGRWVGHCTELRCRIDELSAAGRLVFTDREGEGRSAVTDPGEARLRLLSPCLHMTNNRLRISITDEAHLAHTLVRALRHTEAVH
jgi:hypothetical protein